MLLGLIYGRNGKPRNNEPGVEEGADCNVPHAKSLNESLNRNVAGHCSYSTPVMAMRAGASTPI